MANNNRPPQIDEKQRKFFQELAGPNFVVTASVYQGLHEAAGGDADKMTDELMTLLSDPMADEKRRAEEANRERQEADRKKREEAERKLREEVERRVRQEEAELIRKQEEAFREISRQNEEKRKKEEELRRLAEIERKKADEDQRKLEEEIQRRLVEARKKREEEEAQRLKELEAKKLREEQARRFAEEALRYAEQEREQKQKQKEAELQAQLHAQKAAEQQRALAEAQKRAEDEERIRRRVEEEMRKRLEDERRVAEAQAAAAAAAKREEQRLREEVERRLRLEEQQKAPVTPSPTPSPQKSTTAAPDAAKEQSINEMRAVYDQKLRELEDRLMQYDKKIQEIKKVDTPSAPPSPATAAANKEGSGLAPVAPIVCVLVDNDTLQAKTDEVTAYLTSKGVKATDIRVVNATNDFELVQVVKGQRETLQFPSIIIRHQAVGTLDELKQYAQKIGVLEALLAGDKVDLAAVGDKKSGPTPPELKLGLYDYSISATEFTLKTVGTLVFLPIIAPYKLLSWAFGSKQPELQKGEDIDVIQSNWYWRHQLRTMRFLDDTMLRLRPGYNDVRAMHKYDDVKEIRLADATNIVITYKAGGSDYLRTTPQDVKRICDIISAKNKMVTLVKS